MPQEYWSAVEVRAIANELIYSEHTHLGSIRIDYVFLEEAPKAKGREVWGRAKLVSGLNAWLCRVDTSETEPSPFFVVEVAAKVWGVLPEMQKRALVDHLLSQLDVDIDDSKLTVRPPDFEEFGGVIRRHGAWRNEVAAFLEAAKEGDQLGLFNKPTPSEEETTVTISCPASGLEPVTMKSGDLARAAELMSRRV